MNYLILMILPIVQILLLIFMHNKNKKFIYLIVSGIVTILSFMTGLYSRVPDGLGGIGAALFIIGCVGISIILFYITLCCLIKNHLNSKGKKSFTPIVLLTEVSILIIVLLLRILSDLQVWN